MPFPIYARQPRRHRRPWPNDAVFDDEPIRLGYGSLKDAQRRGPLLSTKPRDQAGVAPSDYGKRARNPVFGHVTTWDDLSDGYGLPVQEGVEAPKRYWYAVGSDCSIPRQIGKGPAITTITPGTKDATVGVTKFFEIAGSLFAINGRYIQKRVSDGSITAPVDFGVGKAAVDVDVFWTNASGVGQYAFIGMGWAELMYRFDGTTASQSADMYSGPLIALDELIYRSPSLNTLAVVDGATFDPWSSLNWSAPNQHEIGSKDQGITGLAATATGAMVVFKPDGVYSLDQSGDDIRYHRAMRHGLDPDSGKIWGEFLNDLYVRYDTALYRLDPSFRIVPSGTELLLDNNSPVRGYPTAFLGHNTWHAYTALHNPDTDKGYLLKYASLPGIEGDVVGDEGGRKMTFHGSISEEFAGKYITAMHKSTIGAPSGHQRMYLGFSDGTWGWFTLPCVPNPFACDQYGVSTADGRIYLSTFTGGFAGDDKALNAAQVDSANLSPAKSVALEYRTVPSHTSWLTLDDDFTLNPTDRREFDEETGGTYIDLALVLSNTATTEGPEIRSFSLEWLLNTDLDELLQCFVQAGSNMRRRDGSHYPRSPQKVRSIVTGLAERRSFRAYFADGVLRIVKIVDFRRTQVWDAEQGFPVDGYQLTIAQVRRGEDVQGQILRLGDRLVGDLTPYTVAQLGEVI